MEQVTENEKRNLSQKFKEFQVKGLIEYGKYLVDQLEYASNSENRHAYKKYIEEQIKMNDEKILKIKENQSS
jgi:hypothetical protein